MKEIIKSYNKNKIIKDINKYDLVTDIFKKLKKNPYFFLKEAEFQAYLYGKLINCDYGFCKTSNDLNNYRIHLEYPRYRNNKKVGRWDIVVLKPGKYRSDCFDESPIELAIETKLNWNSRFKTVNNEFLNDEPVLDSDADRIILFHINVAKKHQNIKDLDKINESIKKLKTKNSNLIYLESYRECREPIVIYE